MIWLIHVAPSAMQLKSMYSFFFFCLAILSSFTIFYECQKTPACTVFSFKNFYLILRQRLILSADELQRISHVLCLCKYGIVCVCVRFQFSGGRDTIPYLLNKI